MKGVGSKESGKYIEHDESGVTVRLINELWKQ